MKRLPDQFAPLLSPDPERNPLFDPFRAMPAEMAETLRASLRDEARRTLREVVVPAVKAFRDYVADTWLPAAPQSVSVTALPHGSEYYELSLQRLNTTRMQPLTRRCAAAPIPARSN